MTVELDYMRRALHLTLHDRVRNEEVRSIMRINGSVTKPLENRALQYMVTSREWPMTKTNFETGTTKKKKGSRPALEWESYIKKAMVDRGLG